MHQHIMQSQMYATMAYLPYNFVATHLYFAASAAAGRVKIAYPTQEFESKSAKLKSNQILQRLVFKRFILLLIFLKIIILENFCIYELLFVFSLYTDMSPSVRCFTSTVAMVRDILPCVLSIVQPNLRPVNTQLFTKSEKDLLQNAIANLVAYRYVRNLTEIFIHV